jgi:hypothetical protein
VTSAQLRIRLGKVRCGQCLDVFNAFDSLITDEDPILPTPTTAIQDDEQPAASDESLSALAVSPEPEPQPAPIREQTESIEESLTAARDAGLVAARELNTTPAYNRWADGTLADGSLGNFAAVPASSARTAYLLVAVPLLLALAAQLLFHFRSELVLRVPALSALYQRLAVDIPLPQKSELVSIESSDLQADTGRGLLILQANLRNRAKYDQAWPLLELSLTDTQDGLVARRVLAAEDYLADAARSRPFSANTEHPVRLTIDAKGVAAAGYRLYVFYP